MRFDRSEPIKNAGAQTPVRKVVLPDGTVREKKLTPIPFHMECVHPNGHTVFVSLATGATIRGFNNNPYGVMIKDEKIRKGFLPTNHCPYAKGYVPLPRDKRGKVKIDPCVGDWPNNPQRQGEFRKGTRCEHLDAIANARKERARKKSERFARRFATNQERLIEELVERDRQLRTGIEVSPKDNKGSMPR